MPRKKREQAATVGKPCALCRQPHRLQYSHIIPEFFYKHLYDDKHSFWLLSTRAEPERVVQQKGEREYLLCRECEDRFQVYEAYAARLFGAADNIGLTIKDLDNCTVIHGIEYKPLKLFLLSVLWRASVSSLAFFQHVQLGPLEEEIRDMLLRDDPGPAALFSCMIWSLSDKGEKVKFMLPPNPTKIRGRVHYMFIFGGYVWNFVASRKTDSHAWDEFVLNENGRLVLGHRTLDDLRPQLDALITEIDRMGRVPASVKLNLA